MLIQMIGQQFILEAQTFYGPKTSLKFLISPKFDLKAPCEIIIVQLHPTLHWLNYRFHIRYLFSLQLLTYNLLLRQFS